MDFILGETNSTSYHSIQSFFNNIQVDMSRPNCYESKLTPDTGVEVETLLEILDDPESSYDGPQYKVEDPGKLKSLRDAGWAAIDISDTNELDNWGSVELDHRIPFNPMSSGNFMQTFMKIFQDFGDFKTIKVILISEDPGCFLEALSNIFRDQHFMDIKVLIADKRRIMTPLN